MWYFLCSSFLLIHSFTRSSIHSPAHSAHLPLLSFFISGVSHLLSRPRIEPGAAGGQHTPARETGPHGKTHTHTHTHTHTCTLLHRYRSNTSWCTEEFTLFNSSFFWILSHAFKHIDLNGSATFHFLHRHCSMWDMEIAYAWPTHTHTVLC